MNHYLKQTVCAASGIDGEDYLEPTVFIVDGDNEMGIFKPAMDTYQVVVANFELHCLFDQTFDTLKAALDAVHQFLLTEYGLTPEAQRVIANSRSGG